MKKFLLILLTLSFLIACTAVRGEDNQTVMHASDFIYDPLAPALYAKEFLYDPKAPPLRASAFIPSEAP